MKIVFMDFPTLNYGGGCEQNFMNLGKWLTNKGHDTAFVTGTSALNNFYCFIFRQGNHTKNISDHDLKNKFHVKKYLTFSFFDLFLPTKKRRDIKRLFESADVIYSKNEIIEVLIAKYVFRINFTKLVFVFHTPFFYAVTKSFKSKLHNWLYNSNVYLGPIRNSKARCLVLTDYDKQLLIKNNMRNSIVTIPNPIDTKIFSEKKYQKGPFFEIYYIGRMTEQKGIDTLASTIERLSSKPEFNHMKFHFVGSGKLDQLLIKLSKKFNNCFFEGFTDNVVKYYHKADLTVAPSRWEGFPHTVLEAQSCGIPVITTNTSGCRDIVKDSITGWISEVDDIQRMEHLVLEAYRLWNENFVEFMQIGKNARRNIVDNYETEKVNSKIENFLLSNRSNT